MDLTCEECGASIRLEPTLRTASCPYCAAPSVVERPAASGLPEPRFVIGFALGQAAARERVAGWQNDLGIFRDPRVRTAPIEAMRGLYVPAYLYAAVAHSRYQASIGENYLETQTYTTTENGRTVTRTRTVTKTEWRSLSGLRSALVPDVLVSASRGVQNQELEEVEPYDFRGLHDYDPRLLSGWIAEHPQLDLRQGVELARAEVMARVGAELGRFMPGDSHRGLQHQTHLDAETIDPLLVPLWVLAVRHAPDRPPVRVLVNGQTGKVWGRAPLSVPRIALAVSFAIALVVGLVLLAERS